MIENTHLFQEIHEQPQVLSQLFEREIKTVHQLAAAVELRGITQVVIAARGTSDNAARYAKYLLGAVNKLTVALATPSLFTIYQQPPNLRNAMVLGISQSGKSPDIVAVLAEARRQGALTAVITNIPDSDLGRTAEYVIDLHAGLEQAVAATKTYTAELAAIALMSAVMAQDLDMKAQLIKIPGSVTKTLTMSPDIERITERYRYMSACVVIGRGYNYATAFELALKLKELTYTVVEPYSSADFMHGPLAMIDSGFPVIVLAPSGRMMPEILQFMEALSKRGAELIVFSDDDAALSAARIPLKLPLTVPEWLSPITTIVAGQLLTLHLAHVRDYDVDHPRAIQKVTQTH